MNVGTQISGNIHSHSTALHALKSMFTQLGINVAHPTQDEPLFYATDVNTAWRRYNNELFFYESITDSTFHTVHNEDKIDENTSRQILYAILKNRPIVVTGKLAFASGVSPFTRELIARHMDTFHPVNLPEFELTELNQLLSKLKPVDYRLLGSEKILINARVKAHFRDLLDQAKEVA